MAVPKKKTTKGKRNMRRMHISIEEPSLVECGKCKQKKVMHTVCGNCGYYKGKKAIDVADEKKGKEEKTEDKPLKMDELSKKK